MASQLGQTAMVAGAAHPLGARLALLLARAGADVVVLDEDEPALRALVRRSAGRISYVRVPFGDQRIVQRLGAIWADEPLATLINVGPLAARQTAAHIRTKALLLGAMQDGLAAARGCVVTVIRGGYSDLKEVGHDAALRAMHQEMSQQLGTRGVRSHLIELEQDTPVSMALRPALALAHRSGDAVHGSVLRLRRLGAFVRA